MSYLTSVSSAFVEQENNEGVFDFVVTMIDNDSVNYEHRFYNVSVVDYPVTRKTAIVMSQWDASQGNSWEVVKV